MRTLSFREGTLKLRRHTPSCSWLPTEVSFVYILKNNKEATKTLHLNFTSQDMESPFTPKVDMYHYRPLLIITYVYHQTTIQNGQRNHCPLSTVSSRCGIELPEGTHSSFYMTQKKGFCVLGHIEATHICVCVNTNIYIYIYSISSVYCRSRRHM